MNSQQAAILPTKDILKRVLEMMVEYDIPTINPEDLMGIIVLASVAHEPMDYIAEALDELSIRHTQVTMHAIPLYQVDGLYQSMLEQVGILGTMLSSMGLQGQLGNIVGLINMTDDGDVIVNVQLKEGEW